MDIVIIYVFGKMGGKEKREFGGIENLWYPTIFLSIRIRVQDHKESKMLKHYKIILITFSNSLYNFEQKGYK